MQKITYDQLTKTQKTNPTMPIISVLAETDFDNAHITGSENIPFKGNTHFIAQVQKAIGGKDNPAILYCASAACDASSNAAKALEAAGFSKISIYEGGVKEWAEKSKKSSQAA